MPQKWFDIKASAGKPAEVRIFDAIGATWDGEGVTAAQFIEQLSAIEADQIVVSVNSPGGSLFDGLAIGNAMRAHPAKITGRVMGVAASAASIALMGADELEMPANTFMMLHKGSTLAAGQADDLRAAADVLDMMDRSIAAEYARRAGKPVEEFIALLDTGDVWVSAERAVELGLADRVTEQVHVEAKFDPAALPEQVRAALKPPAKPPAPARQAGLVESIEALAAEHGMVEYAAVFALDTSLADAAAVTAAMTEARQVLALGRITGRPEQAAQLVQARSSLKDARKALADALAAEDEQLHVDNTLPEPGAARPAPTKPSTTAKGPAAFWTS